MQSRTSSLSTSGILRAEAMALASVDLPVPGCPFMAMIINGGAVLLIFLSSSFDIFFFNF